MGSPRSLGTEEMKGTGRAESNFLLWELGLGSMSQPCPASTWLIFARLSVSLDFSNGILMWEAWDSYVLERKRPWDLEV